MYKINLVISFSKLKVTEVGIKNAERTSHHGYSSTLGKKIMVIGVLKLKKNDKSFLKSTIWSKD